MGLQQPLNLQRQVLPTRPLPLQRRPLCQRSLCTPSNQPNPLLPSPIPIRCHGGTVRLPNNLRHPQLNPPTNNRSLSNPQRPRLTPPTNRLPSLRSTLSRKILNTTTENRKLIPEIILVIPH